MNDYTPRKGSAAEAAVEYLRKKGGPARSAEIAEAIGIEAKNITASLAAAVDNGVLVACDVNVPGSQPQKEYRISGGGKPIPWREPKPARAPVAPPRSETQEAPAEARRTAPIERRKPVGKLITGEAARAMANEAAKPARKPRKTPKPAPAHPRAARRPKATGRLLRAAEEGRRKTAKPARNIPENIPGQEPIRSATNFRCGIFNDGALSMVLRDGAHVELPPEDTRVLFDYLDKTLQVAA